MFTIGIDDFVISLGLVTVDKFVISLCMKDMKRSSDRFEYFVKRRVSSQTNMIA